MISFIFLFAHGFLIPHSLRRHGHPSAVLVAAARRPSCANAWRRLSRLFREPTEMEYLKKLMFECMTGKEVATMTIVIAAIMMLTPEEIKAVAAAVR